MLHLTIFYKMQHHFKIAITQSFFPMTSKFYIIMREGTKNTLKGETHSVQEWLAEGYFGQEWGGSRVQENITCITGRF